MSRMRQIFKHPRSHVTCHDVVTPFVSPPRQGLRMPARSVSRVCYVFCHTLVTYTPKEP
jgi:hypothetical protein